MGQGFSLTTLSAASANIDVPELSELTHEKTLNSGRFMKSIRARNQQGFVFVKAIVKPYPQFELGKYVKRLIRERDILVTLPNTIGYRKVLETVTSGFLVRQYLHSSLYDRMSTRPFLEVIEKKWLAFQLLCAVRDSHAQNIHHGDIKTENVLVTSWNWLYLCDFSSIYKPVYLPEDNPADFSFYFDTSGRRTCYLAPERFVSDGDGIERSPLNWAMDIFSVGCVIAELFLEGPIFSLSHLFKYRAGDYNPEHTHLARIEDAEVRNMILTMIKLNPEDRYSAEEYLNFYQDKIFPRYFYHFLHQYLWTMTDPSSGRKTISIETSNDGETDGKIESVFSDFDKISYLLGHNSTNSNQTRSSKIQSVYRTSLQRSRSAVPQPLLLRSDLATEDGTLLFLTIVTSSLRNTTKSSARLKACDLMIAFGEWLPDEAKLDRVLPFLAGMLIDRSDVVKATALRAVTRLLSTVEVVSPINAYIFAEYLFPRFEHFLASSPTKPSAMTRAAYASCLASLAESSLRLLDVVQSIRASGKLSTMGDNDWTPESTYHGLFDVARADLIENFEQATKELITDIDSSVRRAFLTSVGPLCVFFGPVKANEVILSHLNTYLNDKDWILKCFFFESLVGVATYIGTFNLEMYILPLMLQSLTDVESFVVEKALRTLARMASLGLFQRSTTWELVNIASRFLVHPSSWIREASANLVCQASKHLGTADKHCIIMPMLQPLMRTLLLNISEISILDNVKKPLSKAVLDMAILWAQKTERGIFWKTVTDDALFMLPDPQMTSSPGSFQTRVAGRIPGDKRNEEDEQWLGKLRGLGLTVDDEIKLLALCEYIYRFGQRKSDELSEDPPISLNGIVALNDIKVTPQNVFFDNEEPMRVVSEMRRKRPRSLPELPYTIADALMEASGTMGDPGHDATDGSRKSTAAVEIGKANGISRHADNLERERGTIRPASLLNPNSLGKTLGTSPSSDSDRPGIRKGSQLMNSYQSSALNLMTRKDSIKVEPATSTSAETAVGMLDGPTHAQMNKTPTSLGPPVVTAPDAKSRSSQQSQRMYEPNHTYAGNDENVLRLLDAHFAENYTTDKYEFGQVAPIDANVPIRSSVEPANPANGVSTVAPSSAHPEPWQPSGNLLTVFAEHTAAVNRVVTACDHAFFVTASDDGTCKVWDTTRLEKNVTPRSRVTHRHPAGSKVTALCMLENTHTFVSASDDGTVNAVKLDIKSIDGGESTKYGKPQVVRYYNIPEQHVSRHSNTRQQTDDLPEHAVSLQHYSTSTTSLLLILTTSSRLLAIDLSTMLLSYTLENPLHHGTPTGFVLDKKGNWLVIATSHGIIDMWDLRFRIRVRSFGLKSMKRIDTIALHPGKGRGRWILISTGGEITTWDVEKKVQCREIWRPATNTDSTPSSKSRDASDGYEPYFPDEEPPSKLLARFSSARSLASPSLASQSQSQVITALLPFHDSLYATDTTTSPTKAPFILTGGSDRTLRLWNIAHPEQSSITSSPHLADIEDITSSPSKDTNIMALGNSTILPRLKAACTLSYPTSVSLTGSIALVTETLPSTLASISPHGGSSTQTTPIKKRSTRAGTGTPESKSSVGSGGTNATKPPRNTIISLSQQALLRAHLDGITAVALLRKPYGCIVSCDRSGAVYVFQ